MVRSSRRTPRSARAALAAMACAWMVGAPAAPWTPAGPADGGGTPAGGAIATHPAAGGVAMIVAGAVDGLAPAATFVTSDGGAHWAANARHGGVGRPYLGGAPAIAYLATEGAVLRSFDSGRSFAPLALPFAGIDAAAPPQVRAVNPADGRELLVSAGRDLAHSKDGGATWVLDRAPSDPGALVVDWSTRTIHAALQSPATVGHRPLDMPGAWTTVPIDARVLAAGQGVVLAQAATGALLRSTDGGATFQPVAGIPGPLALCEIAFASAPAPRVYGLECSNRRVLVSHDLGANFGVAGVLAPGILGTAIAVDAANPSLVYVATTRGVLRSVDGGASFAPLDRAGGAPGRGRALILDARSAVVRYLTDPPGVRPGYARSADAGVTWIEVDGGRRLLAASRDRAGVVFGALGDGEGGDAELSQSEDGGITWYHRITAYGPGTSFGPIAYGAAPGEVYLYASSPDELGPNARIFASTDDGGTWTLQDPPPVLVRAMATSQSAPVTIYAGGVANAPGAPQLYKLADAQNWTAVATFPGSSELGNEITVIHVDRADPRQIWVGFREADYVMFSGDGGATWSRRTKGLGAGAVTSIVPDPAGGAALHLTQAGGGIFRSGNGGETWTALDDGLDDDVVLRADFDPFVAFRLYASTASGLYQADARVAYPSGDRRAIEYRHAAMGHYFVSSDTDEIAGLDAGVFPGWSRTGEGFRVAEGTATGNEPVCRYFGVGFAPQSSHFYSPYAHECDLLGSDPAWVYEKIAFGLALPSPDPGCPPGTRALHRLFNAMAGGAPNHRYTTSMATAESMAGSGWVFEGQGATRVFACVPY